MEELEVYRKAIRRTEIQAEKSGLSAFDLFEGLPASQLLKVEQKAGVRQFAEGDVLFELGGTGEKLYLLEAGRVQTYRMMGVQKLVIADLQAPAVLGEMGCIGQCVYHCTARVTERSIIRIVLRKDLEVLMEEFPQVTRRLLDLVGRRFVRVLLDLEGMSFRPLLPRLATLLLEKAEGDTVKNMTHKDLAERLRAYRESTTAALSELRRAGIVKVERKRIRILDHVRLERASRE